MDGSLQTQLLVDERGAAKILCCSVAFLRKQRLLRVGIPYIKLGSLVRYDIRAIESTIQQQQQKQRGN